MKRKDLTAAAAVLLVSLLVTGCSAQPAATGASNTSNTSNTSGSSGTSGAAGSSGTVDKDAKVSKSDFYFDTVITITLYGTEDAAPIDECFAMAADFENKFSNTKDDSEVSLINAKAGTGEYVTVSDDTLELIEDGLKYCEISEDHFDITLGALSGLWNISELAEDLEETGNEGNASMIPSEEEIQEALATVDYQAVEIDGNNVRITEAGTQLDLGGIAKGFIADKMKDYLVSAGIESAIINLGGNVLTIGSKPDGSEFTIGIQKPFADGEVMAAIKTSGQSVVTSGIYERYFKVDSKIYHHILDLTTGYPCDNDLYSVTIVSDSSMDGDALSTTCFVLGLDEGMELIESMDGVEAVFVTSDMKFHKTSGIGKTVTFKEM